MSSPALVAPFGFVQGPLLWVLIVLALLGVGVLAPFGIRWLFGPVPFYDLVQTARRRRYYLIRFLYITGLLVFLFWTYGIWSMDIRYRSRSGTTVKDMADLADRFFYTFMSIQFAVVALLTPAYTAGSIADEKDRRTLEFLLATDLRSREIVLGKLVARLANLLLLLLAGLPILGFMQFFGGIDPDLLLAAYAALVVSTFSLAGLSMVASVYSRKARDAIVLTYLAAAVYLAVSALAWGSLKAWPSVGMFPSFPDGGWTSPVELKDLVDWLNTGNAFIALVQLVMAFEQGGSFASILPDLLGKYALFHLLMGSLCIFLAVMRLRPVALKETYGRVKRLPVMVRLLGRPQVGNQPMLWKETVAEPGMRFNWLGRILVGIVLIVSFLPLIPIGYDFQRYRANQAQYSYYWNDPWDRLAEEVNIYVRITGAIVATLVLLAIAVRAASAISGERDKQTLDSLLTTPLSGNEILTGKWLGCLVGFRFAWLWLGAILAIGIVFGAIHFTALFLVIFAFVVYCVVFAGIGLLYSMRCRTTLRSTLWTLLTVVFLGGGHWLVGGLCCMLPVGLMSRSDKEVEWLMKFEAGQSPPFVLGWLAFRGEEFNNAGKEYTELTLSCLFGLFCWTVGAVALWAVASARFNVLANRAPGHAGPASFDRRSFPPTGPPLPAEPVILDAIPLEDDAPRDGPPRTPS
jgi:ABC-type transport system involved in multi-copper enzyme maturation permease subunit